MSLSQRGRERDRAGDREEWGETEGSRDQKCKGALSPQNCGEEVGCPVPTPWLCPTVLTGMRPQASGTVSCATQRI